MDINVKTDISYVNVCIFSWNIQNNNIIFAADLIIYLLKTEDYYYEQRREKEAVVECRLVWS